MDRAIPVAVKATLMTHLPPASEERVSWGLFWAGRFLMANGKTNKDIVEVRC